MITPGAQQTQRLVLTPKVLATIDRQRGSTQTMMRRRHGRRIAEERKARGEQPAFMKTLRPITPAQRAKADSEAREAKKRR